MKRYIIDTNGYLRLLLNDLPEQADKVEELLTQAKRGKILIFLPQIIVFEIVFILEKYYGFNKDEVLNKVESLVSVGYVEVESKEIFLKSISLYRDNNVSFVDCFLFVSANEGHADIFTFDKKLENMK